MKIVYVGKNNCKIFHVHDGLKQIIYTHQSITNIYVHDRSMEIVYVGKNNRKIFYVRDGLKQIIYIHQSLTNILCP